MEVLTSILDAAAVEISRRRCGSFSNIKNFIRFQSNLNDLEKKMNSLIDLRSNVKEEVDLSNTQKMEWLRDVQQIIFEAEPVQAGRTTNKQKLCGCFFNCSERYEFSRETVRIVKEIERLLKIRNIIARTECVNHLAKKVEYIPGPSIRNQTTAPNSLAKVMNLLNDDNVQRIGVWGMGGVGKTTLVKNLNNNLKNTSSTQQFGVVIWATVSKELDLKRVQIQIAERLNLEMIMGESVERLAVRLHQRLQRENKFLLILDDVWQMIDLDALGVPQPEVHTGSKIILTSRSLEICREMKTDEEVKVDVLNDEEAWQLFSRSAGKVATLKHIEPLARVVARECSGLPLAIITVGTAMRGKTMIELWKDALNELRRSVPHIRGIEDRVFRPLKWSYDSLQGKNIKPCFLYCALYPEDFSIEVSELVNCWLAEGLIDEQQNYEDLHNRGIALIENLKDSCLLEEGAHESTVKMHDVIRDVAIWISSSLDDGYKSLVRSGIGLTRISEAEMSTSLKRISFINNKILGLPDRGIQCPEASSLLLQGHLPLERIPDGFLQAFQSLRILNVSGTNIQSLPQSILHLVDLKVLLLRDCRLLEELTQLGMLSKLQVLDCCATRIRELPSEMENLSNLRV
ncbi:disease resistance protein At4g27190-like [Pistacia vera]|uniref:disease resistance protein At4g27190-like n=1 Tax=Pistacia vera TaxID=55513 RepID=UPI001262E34F|nr:disease resistance protein At4g27190-like [Pistacia vera]